MSPSAAFYGLLLLGGIAAWWVPLSGLLAAGALAIYVLVVLLFTVGIVAAAVPAWGAMRLRVVDALRRV